MCIFVVVSLNGSNNAFEWSEVELSLVCDQWKPSHYILYLFIKKNIILLSKINTFCVFNKMKHIKKFFFFFYTIVYLFVRYF